MKNATLPRTGLRCLPVNVYILKLIIKKNGTVTINNK